MSKAKRKIKPNPQREIEIRRDKGDGRFGGIDEIVADGLDSFHLERMDTDSWFLGIKKGKHYLNLSIGSSRRSRRGSKSDEGDPVEVFVCAEEFD